MNIGFTLHKYKIHQQFFKMMIRMILRRIRILYLLLLKYHKLRGSVRKKVIYHLDIKCFIRLIITNHKFSRYSHLTSHRQQARHLVLDLTHLACCMWCKISHQIQGGVIIVRTIIITLTHLEQTPQCRLCKLLIICR